MLDKKQLKLRSDNVKINILFLLLLASNIILIFGLVYYYRYKLLSIKFDTINNVLTVLATIIILGFISTRLPQFRKLGDSYLYEIGYLIIIGILSIVISYFNSTTHSQALVAPFLEMFKILSVTLILVLIAAKTMPFKDILNRKFNKKNQFICLVVFTALGILASKSHIYVNDAPANIRCLIVMISGLFGGPFVGIPTGIISGAYRYILGGPTALPCAISTLISGIVGSLIFIWNDKKFPRIIPSIVLMFLYTGFEMFLIVVLTPPQISFTSIGKIYPLMLFSSVVGIILFSMILKEEKQNINKPLTYEELKIKEIETELEGYEDRIEELEEEVEELKKEKSNYP